MRLVLSAVVLALSTAASCYYFLNPKPKNAATIPSLNAQEKSLRGENLTPRKEPERSNPVEAYDFERLTFYSAPKPLAPDAKVSEWPGFLGSQQNAMVAETRLRKDFSNGEGGVAEPVLLWSIARGEGYAAPAVAHGRLVYTHRMAERVWVECLHAENGRRFWYYTYGSDYEDRFGYSNGPRASPVIDYERVYIYGAKGELICLKFQTGTEIWRAELARRYGVTPGFFGAGSTPLIWQDLLIVQTGVEGGPEVVAFDKATGREIWRAGSQWGTSYASPMAARIHDRDWILIFAGGDRRPPDGGLIVIDAANGEITGRFTWRSSSYESVNAANPIIVGERIFLTASYKTGGVMLRLNPDGSLQQEWTTHALGSHWSTPIYVDGYIYGIDGRHTNQAALVCLDINSGKEIWREAPVWQESVSLHGRQQDLRMHLGRASLLHADESFLCLGELGTLAWLSLSPDPVKPVEILARRQLFYTSDCWTPPVLSHGLLYIAQNSPSRAPEVGPRLLCYDLRAH